MLTNHDVVVIEVLPAAPRSTRLLLTEGQMRVKSEFKCYTWKISTANKAENIAAASYRKKI